MTQDPGLNLMETMTVPAPIQSPPQCPSKLCQKLTCHLLLRLQGRKHLALCSILQADWH